MFDFLKLVSNYILSCNQEVQIQDYYIFQQGSYTFYYLMNTITIIEVFALLLNLVDRNTTMQATFQLYMPNLSFFKLCVLFSGMCASCNNIHLDSFCLFLMLFLLFVLNFFIYTRLVLLSFNIINFICIYYDYRYIWIYLHNLFFVLFFIYYIYFVCFLNVLSFLLQNWSIFSIPFPAVGVLPLIFVELVILS